MSCPTGTPETISKVLDLESISAGTRQCLRWWVLMDRVRAWTCLCLQFLLRRGTWWDMNLLWWKHVRNRMVCMGIWGLQLC
jgi:hypothetical protein